MMLHIYNLQPMSLPSINFLHLTFSDIQPRQDFKGQRHYSTVNSKPYNDVPHLHPPSWGNVSTKFQLPIPNGCQGIAWSRLFQTQDNYGKVKGQIKVTP